MPDERDPIISDLPRTNHILTPEEFHKLKQAFEETAPCGREMLAEALANEAPEKPAQEFEVGDWKVKLFYPSVTGEPRWEAVRGNERRVNPMPKGTRLWDTMMDARKVLGEL